MPNLHSLRPSLVLPVVALAFLAGCLTAFPQLIAEYRMGAEYQGVRPLVVDDQLYYMARAHETLDGHPTLGSPYFAEDKDNPGVQFWIPDAVVASVSFFLFHNLNTGSIFWDFILPFVDVIAVFVLLYLLTKNNLLSLSLTAMLNLGIFFFSLNRTPHPQLLFLLIVALILLYQMIQRRSLLWIALAAISGGILFYAYPFYWTYWIVTVVIAGAASWLFVRTERLTGKYVYALIGAVLIGIFYFRDQYVASRLSYYQESLFRIGVIHSRFPSGILVVTLVAFTLAVMGFAWLKNLLPRTSRTVLVASGSLAGAVVMNQHLITDMNFQFTVHYTMPAVYMCIFALAYTGVCAFEAPSFTRFVRYRMPVLILVAAISFVVVIANLVPTITRIATPQPSDIAAQRYGPVLAWLNTHTKTDDVVYSDETFSSYVPGYTGDDVMFAPEAELSYLPQSEINARFLAVNYLDSSFTATTVIDHAGDVFGAGYVGQFQHITQENKLRALFHLPPIAVSRYPEAAVTALVAEEHQLQQGSFRAALGGYRADYLVWDSVLDPDWKVADIPGLTKLFASNGIIVYAIASTTPQ